MDNAPVGTVRFGKYVLLDRIGRGGMSDVFLAKTEGIEGFERKIALKRIFPTLSSNPQFVQSFIHEAKVGGMLYHHNVVQTLDFGRFQDIYYIALEYIEGTNLSAVLARCRDRQRPLPPGVFLQLALQIFEGLDYIHHASVEGTDLRLVHRDVKPSNMLITAQGLLKISDFGVVKAAESPSKSTPSTCSGGARKSMTRGALERPLVKLIVATPVTAESRSAGRSRWIWYRRSLRVAARSSASKRATPGSGSGAAARQPAPASRTTDAIRIFRAATRPPRSGMRGWGIGAQPAIPV